MVISSAPGKLMLFGEHAVVYGYPCLVTAVDVRYTVSIEVNDETDIIIQTPSLKAKEERFSIKVEELPNYPLTQQDTKFVVAVLQEMYSRGSFQKGLKIKTYGPDMGYGLGSSSAISVATAHALSTILSLNLSKDDLFKAAFASVLTTQGTGSGFDVAAATYGGTLYYQIGKTVKRIDTGKMPLIIGFTGEKVSTVDLIQKVKQLKNLFPDVLDLLFQTIENITKTAYKALIKQDWETLGKLANLNQGIIQSLDVSTPSLDSAIKAAKLAGAYGAKLSGAGGGDCMFAIATEIRANAVIKALTDAGMQVLQFDTDCEGVRLENKLPILDY